MSKNKQSKKIFYLMLLMLALSIISDASIISNDRLMAEENENKLNNNSAPNQPNRSFSISEEIRLNIEQSISDLTIYEKCAQMVMPAVYRGALIPGSKDHDKIVELVKNFSVGGIVMFQGNSEDQAAMIKKLQEIAKIPLLVSGDYENGLGMRIDDAVSFPHSMAVGATNNYNFAFQVGKETAIQGRRMGINFNLAPVADINDNPYNPIINIRAYSQDKKIVSSFVNAFIKGSDEGRMLTAVKHFPGHGNTFTDSHDDIPKISGSKDYLLSNELVPFINAIENDVKCIMIGHLEVPSLQNEEKIPATLSYPIVTELLREELGFDGLIITDAIDMRAITKYFSQEEAAVKAVLAGNDIILSPLKPKEVIDAIHNAVVEGIIDEDRINESVRKIFYAKYWLGILEGIQLNLKPEFEGQKIIAQQIADESITLLKDENDLLPLNLNKFGKIAVVSVTDGSGGLITEYFSDLLRIKKNDINTVKLTRNSKKRDYTKIESDALKSDLVIIASYIKVRPNSGPVEISNVQKEFIKNLSKSGKKIILISFDNPYLISEFPMVDVYINTYSSTEFSQQAALKAILGEIQFKGKLPVSIPKTGFILGDGLTKRNKTIN